MILAWLSDRLSRPAEPIVRTYGRREKRMSARHYRMAADYLDGTPIKVIADGKSTMTLYRTLKRLHLEPERKRRRRP